ncbi:hypothetical protein D3C85_1732280 [compost metagenome]
MLPGVFKSDGGDGVVNSDLALLRVQMRLTNEIQAESHIFLQRQPWQQAWILERHGDTWVSSG